MSIRQQLGQLLWQHGVENDALLDALDWKMRKIMDERDRLREALTIISEHKRAPGWVRRIAALGLALAKEAGK